jgi:DNA-binding winged helix-turn-helix (wHTH) protein
MVYEFEGFRLDPAQRTLLQRDAGRVAIAPRAFEALCFLVAHRGTLVEKSALMSAVWPNVIVSENSLSQCIAAIRRALGDEAGESRYVATVPGRGYQFIATLETPTSEGRPDSSTQPRPTEDAQAYELVLQATSLFTRPNPQNLARAAELFGHAIERDPSYARAYLGRAHTHQMRVVFDCAAPDSLVQCERNARVALSLDSTLAHAHALLGAVNAHRGQWLDAERHFNAGLAADPRDPQVVMPYAMNMLVTPGYLRRALETLREALGHAPALAGIPSALTLVCTVLGMNAEAKSYGELALALGWSRTLGPVADSLALLAVREGAFDRACSVMVDGISAPVAAAGGETAVRLVYDALAKPELREAAVASLKALEAGVAPVDLDRTTRHRFMLWHAQLGALDAAFATGNRLLDHFASFGSIGTVWAVLWQPETEAFRLDQRFMPFCERLGLPTYWARHSKPPGD